MYTQKEKKEELYKRQEIFKLDQRYVIYKLDKEVMRQYIKGENSDEDDNNNDYLKY